MTVHHVELNANYGFLEITGGINRIFLSLEPIRKDSLRFLNRFTMHLNYLLQETLSPNLYHNVAIHTKKSLVIFKDVFNKA